MAKPKIKSRPKAETLTLPDSRSEICQDLKDYAIWLYGPPKIGKTSLSDLFGKVFHLMYEDGGKALKIFKRHPTRWSHVAGYRQLFIDSDYDMAVHDVAEDAYKLAFKDICKSLGISYPDELEYGKGWAAINDGFMEEMLSWLTIPGKGCMFISHSSQKTRKTFEGEEITDIHPAMSGKILDLFSGKMDIIGYYHYRKGQRVLQIRGDDEVMAGCRLEDNFRHTDGSEIKYIPMGNSKEESHRNFMAAFNNELDPPVIEKKSVFKAKKRK